MQVLEVSSLSAYLQDLVDSDPVLQDAWVRGEVSNYYRSAAGHVYFTLKDERSQLRCVLFRGRAVLQTYVPRDGDAVIAHGRISVYETGGVYQLYVDVLQPDGVGALNLAFEQLRQKLETEGLFAPERKRPLPAFPRRIGVVTSPGGAALQDVITVIKRRYPLVALAVAPTLVQGEGAPAQIVAAMQALGELGDLDLILVARGGGSWEDLWAFNDESVARAIFAARVPVVTGVGHAVDVTIADYVADLHAPTPSAAAELIVPDVREFLRGLEHAGQRLDEAVRRRTGRERVALGACNGRLARSSPLGQIGLLRQRIAELTSAVNLQLQARLDRERAGVRARSLQLAALDPRRVLSRGYTICRLRETGTIVRAALQVREGAALTLTFADGVIEARAEDGAGREAAHGRTDRAIL